MWVIFHGLPSNNYSPNFPVFSSEVAGSLVIQILCTATSIYFKVDLSGYIFSLFPAVHQLIVKFGFWETMKEPVWEPVW